MPTPDLTIEELDESEDKEFESENHEEEPHAKNLEKQRRMAICYLFNKDNKGEVNNTNVNSIAADIWQTLRLSHSYKVKRILEDIMFH
jgi:hypothetical protein